MPIPIKASDVKVGMLLDFAGDEFANNETAEFEFARVDEIEQDGPECIVLHTNQGSFGFPVEHLLQLSEFGRRNIKPRDWESPTGEKLTRTYVVTSRARFAFVSLPTVTDPNLVEDFVLQVASDSDRNNYEFLLKWYALQNTKPPALKITIFDDAFDAFSDCEDFFNRLALWGDKSPSPDDIETILLSLGWTEDESFKVENKGAYPC